MRSILPIVVLFTALVGCEEQTGPRTATTSPAATEAHPESDIVDMDALSRPGSADYLGALSGAKKSAERLKGQINDYNDDLEEEIDNLFDN